MVTNFSPQKSCEMRLENVKASQLNFSIQETPFSVYLTLRKSFSKKIQNPRLKPQPATPHFVDVSSGKISELERELASLRTENSTLADKNKILETDQNTLAKNYEAEVLYSENIKTELESLATKCENAENTIEKIEIKLSKTENEKKALESKHEKTCAEVKKIKSEKKELVKEVDNISIVLKRAKKEAKENADANEKLVKNQDKKIKELLEFKILKTSEDKELKNKQKKLEKKLKAVFEREAKLNLEKRQFNKRKGNENKNKSPSDKLDTVDFEQVDEEKEPEEDLTAYNLPVSPNPFKVLDDDENDCLIEINNNRKDVCEAFEKEETLGPLEIKKNYMSTEQEKAFLKQFEKIMTEALSTNKMEEPT